MKSLLNGGIIYANEESAHALLGSFVPAEGEQMPEPVEPEGQFTTYEGPLAPVSDEKDDPGSERAAADVETEANGPESNVQAAVDADVEADAGAETPKSDLTLEQLGKLTNKEIADYAEARGIDLAGCSRKQDMLDAIDEAAK